MNNASPIKKYVIFLIMIIMNVFMKCPQKKKNTKKKSWHLLLPNTKSDQIQGPSICILILFETSFLQEFSTNPNQAGCPSQTPWSTIEGSELLHVAHLAHRSTSANKTLLKWWSNREPVIFYIAANKNMRQTFTDFVFQLLCHVFEKLAWPPGQSSFNLVFGIFSPFAKAPLPFM